jgi:uncharacterized lipoprotein YbaY
MRREQVERRIVVHARVQGDGKLILLSHQRKLHAIDPVAQYARSESGIMPDPIDA